VLFDAYRAKSAHAVRLQTHPIVQQRLCGNG
jgi:hypothetical protein